jgi:hypothetical protein
VVVISILQVLIQEYGKLDSKMPGAGGDQRGKRVPGRRTAMFKVQAPSAEQLVERHVSRTGGAANLGSATAVVANFVASSGSCDRDHSPWNTPLFS